MRDKALLLGMLLVVTHLTACEGMDPVAPSDQGSTVSPAAAPVIVTELGIDPLAGSGLSGSVTLTRSVDGLWADIQVEGLIDGNAYSIWWAIFDNPQGCDANGCDSFDLRNIRQAQGSLVNGGGFVGDADGALSHQTHLARHDVEGKSVEAGDPSGVDNPFGAEVHIVIRSHGDAESDPDDLTLQIGTFGEFCNLPIGDGCQNQGASMFMKPGAPGQGS